MKKMKKLWYNWSKPRKIISIVCISLCCVMLAGCVVNMFSGSKNGAFNDSTVNVGDKIAGAVGISKTRNSQNMLDPEYYSDKIEGRQNGVKVTVNDDGSITLDGEVNSFTKLELINLPGVGGEVEYLNDIFTVSSVDFGSESDESCLGIGSAESDIGIVKISSERAVTFNASDWDGSLYILLYEGDKFDDVTIYPTLNPGFCVCPFYEDTSVLNTIFKKNRNTNNLFDPEYYDSIDGEHNGVDVTVNKDGSITLDGKATSDFSLTLAELSGESVYGIYFTLSGFNFGEDAPGTSLMYDHVEEESFYIHNGYSSTVLIDFATIDSLHAFEIYISSGDEFDNVTIYPVLNYGITAEPYFK